MIMILQLPVQYLYAGDDGILNELKAETDSECGGICRLRINDAENMLSLKYESGKDNGGRRLLAAFSTAFLSAGYIEYSGILRELYGQGAEGSVSSALYETNRIRCSDSFSWTGARSGVVTGSGSTAPDEWGYPSIWGLSTRGGLLSAGIMPEDIIIADNPGMLAGFTAGITAGIFEYGGSGTGWFYDIPACPPQVYTHPYSEFIFSTGVSSGKGGDRRGKSLRKRLFTGSGGTGMDCRILCVLSSPCYTPGDCSIRGLIKAGCSELNAAFFGRYTGPNYVSPAGRIFPDESVFGCSATAVFELADDELEIEAEFRGAVGRETAVPAVLRPSEDQFRLSAGYITGDCLFQSDNELSNRFFSDGSAEMNIMTEFTAVYDPGWFRIRIGSVCKLLYTGIPGFMMFEDESIKITLETGTDIPLNAEEPGLDLHPELKWTWDNGLLLVKGGIELSAEEWDVYIRSVFNPDSPENPYFLIGFETSKK